jgi:hypothetical protein
MDMMDACKAAVLKCAFGLKSETEANLLRRLEDLYLEGVRAGVQAANHHDAAPLVGFLVAKL